MPSDWPELSIEEVYAAVRALPVDQRDGYIEAHCADPAARAELHRRLSEITRTLPPAGQAPPPAPHREPPALAPGRRIGHYRIQRSIGSGGMGFVYEALDENLNRTVALKVLPMDHYDQASRLRFRREAETASALNHPNIVTVHEIGRDGDIDFIAMERISGRTLHKVIGGRPLPLLEAVRIATQIAGALAAAHEAGIVHRDLKPSNVMLTDRGLVKVLDFGLAKLVVQDTQLTAEGEVLSHVGDVVGTSYYMSPEQALGKPVDARSDIFSFGSVLYELITGKRAFQRETIVAALVAISSFEPEPLRTLRPDVPKLLESVFVKCTRKQPFERWQSLSDVRLILQDLAADLESATPAARQLVRDESRRQPSGLRWLWPALGAGAAGVLLTVGAQYAWTPPATQPSVPVLRMVTAEKGLATAPALSRDGSLLAFASDRAGQGNLDIWIQQIGGAEPLRLTSDPADESTPAFSADGARVAFRSEKDGGGIYMVPALGGDPVLLAPRGRNPRFSPDGKSLTYWEGREGSMIPGLSKAFVLDIASGSTRQLQTDLAWAQYPLWSPDGGTILLYGMPKVALSRSAVDWWLVPAGGGKARQLRLRDSAPLARETRALPVALDWFAGEGGEPTVFFAPGEGDNANLWRIGLAARDGLIGPPVAVTKGPGRQLSASLARGKEGWSRLSFADEAINYDVWRLQVHPGTGLAEGPLQPVTDRLTAEMSPCISGDGNQAYFITKRLGTWSIVRKELDTNRERVLYSSPEYIYNTRAAARGSKLFFTRTRDYQLLAIPLAGGAIETVCTRCGSLTGVSPDGGRMLMEPAEDEHLMMFDAAAGKLIKLADRGDPHLMLSGGQFSPDGQWVAFSATHNQTQTSGVYVIPVSGPLPVPKDQWIRVAGDNDLSRDPVFAPAGPFLYYTSEADGFRCVWARRLHPVTLRPEGEPFPVNHFHTTRLAPRTRASSANIIGLSGGGRHLMFALTETTGNIWLEETKSGH